jgi:hypothetical protein
MPLPEWFQVGAACLYHGRRFEVVRVNEEVGTFNAIEPAVGTKWLRFDLLDVITRFSPITTAWEKLDDEDRFPSDTEREHRAGVVEGDGGGGDGEGRDP